MRYKRHIAFVIALIVTVVAIRSVAKKEIRTYKDAVERLQQAGYQCSPDADMDAASGGALVAHNKYTPAEVRVLKTAKGVPAGTVWMMPARNDCSQVEHSSGTDVRVFGSLVCFGDTSVLDDLEDILR